jgi:hypothetical protein
MIRALSRVRLLVGACSSALAVLAGVGFSAHVGAAPGAEPQVLVMLAGDRPDAWKMQAAVASLLGLEGIAVIWRRSSSPPTVDDQVGGDEVMKQPRPDHRVLVDITDPAIVSLRLLATAGAVAPAARIVEAPVLDEATCETVAQILRSVVLAPGESPPVSAPAPAMALIASASPSPSPPPEPPDVARRRRFELRSGYVAAASPGDLGWLSGATLAGSWALTRGAGSPVVVLGLSRVAGDFAAPRRAGQRRPRDLVRARGPGMGTFLGEAMVGGDRDQRRPRLARGHPAIQRTPPATSCWRAPSAPFGWPFARSSAERSPWPVPCFCSCRSTPI